MASAEAQAEHAEEPALAKAAKPVTPLPVRPRSRVPLALAATVVLSSIAVLLATRVDREQQAEQTRILDAAPVATNPAQPAAAPSPGAAPAAAGAPAPAAAAPAKAPAEPSAAAPAAAYEQAAPLAERSAPGSGAVEHAKKAAPVRNDNARARIADEPMPAPSAAAPPPPAITGSLAEAPLRRAPAPTAAAPMPAAPSAATPMPATPAAPAPVMAAPTMNADEVRASERMAAALPAPAPAPAATAPESAVAAAPAPAPAAKPAGSLAREAKKAEAPDTARYAHEDDPVRWLDHIKHLRGQGLDAEADVQLKRFRERYPSTRIPPEALRRVGTQ